MSSSYISKRAVIMGKIFDEVVIYGPSKIGRDTFIDRWVQVGYPTRERLLKTIRCNVLDLDSVSEGSIIGERCIIRSSSIIYDRVEIGDDVEIGHGVLIRSNSIVGSRCKVGSFTQLDGEVHLGEQVIIQSMVYLPHLTEVGDGTFIGPNVVVTNDKYPIGRLEGVKIGKNVVIGANSTILAGVEIGDEAVIAAGSVVTHNIPSSIVVKGVPAKPYISREEYELKKNRV
ncbi:MAG: N-acetyltransferase [Aigarchaeota archaeon]|nr:N-acetyltransferase [Aigarchaeota archaeon]MCX8192213.1 N-acetyltransferase [Nitrososphaeria archaeon]MDW7986179.1 DapH/DapD/GlmU-related protein [Nitrososphaerota archaeon]